MVTGGVEEAFCQVAFDLPLRTVFDYRCPEQTHPQPGVRVKAPFGRGQRIGIVISLGHGSRLAADKIKTISAVLDPEPLLDADLLELLHWSASYYHHPLGEVLAAALPGLLRKGAAGNSADQPVWSITRSGADLAGDALGKAPRQRRILQLLRVHGPMSAAELARHEPDWRPPMRALIGKGLAAPDRRRKPRPPSAVEPADDSAAHLLNADQEAAVAHLGNDLGKFAVTLLHGVTGSGKTEVYLQLAAKALARGLQTLVLVPEIGLTGQTLDRFQQRLGRPVTLLHSGLSERQRADAWSEARQGTPDIILGTRSAVFCPLTRPGLIIIDEEHDTSFKQQEGFRYHARDLAIKRAQLLGIPVLLGSATPSLESWHNARQGLYRLLTLPERAGSAKLPAIRLFDARHTRMSGLISQPLLQLIERYLQAGGQVLLFLNRRGFAPLLLCHQCGAAPRCERCEQHYTLHLGRRRMVCHHCGAERPMPERCPECHSRDLLPLGVGTERIAAAIRDQFPDWRMLRIDRDTTRQKGRLQEGLDSARSGAARILLGTQMLAKGHHFPQVSLVAILDGDQGLFATDFRATERLVQTLFQVAGRGGRGDLPGEVVVQTHSPEHPLWSHLLHLRYEELANLLLAERQQADMPPITHFALLRAEAVQPRLAQDFLTAVRGVADTSGVAGVTLLGPIPAPMEKRAGRYRAQLLLQARQRPPLQRLLHYLMPLVEELPLAKKNRWSLDVDPVDLY